MKWILIAGLLAAIHADAQDARSIVEKSSVRIKALKSIQLNVILKDHFIGEISADIIIVREKLFPVFGISKVKMTGMVIEESGSKALSMAYDGNVFSYINAGKNELVIIENPTYSKIGRTGQLSYGMAIPSIYYEGFAFDSILTKTVKLELLPDTVIFNRPVYSINIVQRMNDPFNAQSFEQGTVWYFDKESYLPAGNSFSGNSRYYKTKFVNKDYNATDFSLKTGN